MFNAKYAYPEKAEYIKFGWFDNKEPYCPIGFKTASKPQQEYTLDLNDPSDFSIKLKVGTKIFCLPLPLKHIAFTIEESKEILALDDDWDNNNGLKIEFETWASAVELIIVYASFILDNFNTPIIAPEINPVGNGSVDIVWRTKEARLLMNVKPPRSPVIASYYGDLYNNGQEIRNVIKDDSIVEHLAFWMKNLNK